MLEIILKTSCAIHDQVLHLIVPGPEIILLNAPICNKTKQGKEQGDVLQTLFDVISQSRF